MTPSPCSNSPTGGPDPRESERGLALMLALLTFALLAIMVTQFAWTAKVDDRLSRNSSDDLKMNFAARGALAYTRGYLRADRNDEETTKLDSLREEWADALNQPVTMGDVALELEVHDAESRLNVNLIGRKDTKAFAAGVLRRLCAHLNLENADEVSDRIIDFIDEDAEGDYEEDAKNGPLLSPEE
ncbi:MAG: hypothetical protein ACYS22_15005, partial [Planctomycetota bacterium]